MVPGYVALLDADCNLHYVNNEFCRLFGEPAGRSCFQAILGRDEPCGDCPIKQTLSTGRSQEWERIAADGRSFHVRGYPFRDESERPMVLELGIETTDRRRLEAEILRISETERLRFGHDLHDSLGQILGGISCLAQVLRRRLQTLEMPVSYWGKEDKACPRCSRVIKAAAVRCRFCGAEFETQRPQESHEYAQQQSLTGKVATARKLTIGLLIMSLLTCLAPVAAIIGAAYWATNRTVINAMPGLHAALFKIATFVAVGHTILAILVSVALSAANG